MLVRGAAIAERHDPVDHRGQLPLPDEVHDLPEVAVAAHRAAEDADLLPEDEAQIHLHHRAARPPDIDQPASPREGPDAGDPCGRADVVDHHIDAPLAGCQEHGLRPVFLPVVDRKVCTESLGARHLLFRGCDRVHGGAEVFGNLHGRAIHPAARAHDRHALACLKPGTRDQHAPGGQVDQQGRGCFGKIEIVRDGHEVGRGHDHVVCAAAPHILAQDVIVRAQAVLAPQRPLILAGNYARVHHDARARGRSIRVAPIACNDAGDICAAHVRLG